MTSDIRTTSDMRPCPACDGGRLIIPNARIAVLRECNTCDSTGTLSTEKLRAWHNDYRDVHQQIDVREKRLRRAVDLLDRVLKDPYYIGEHLEIAAREVVLARQDRGKADGHHVNGHHVERLRIVEKLYEVIREVPDVSTVPVPLTLGELADRAGVDIVDHADRRRDYVVTVEGADFGNESNTTVRIFAKAEKP